MNCIWLSICHMKELHDGNTIRQEKLKFHLTFNWLATWRYAWWLGQIQNKKQNSCLIHCKCVNCFCFFACLKCKKQKLPTTTTTTTKQSDLGHPFYSSVKEIMPMQSGFLHSNACVFGSVEKWMWWCSTATLIPHTTSLYGHCHLFPH